MKFLYAACGAKCSLGITTRRWSGIVDTLVFQGADLSLIRLRHPRFLDRSSRNRPIAPCIGLRNSTALRSFATRSTHEPPEKFC